MVSDGQTLGEVEVDGFGSCSLYACDGDFCGVVLD